MMAPDDELQKYFADLPFKLKEEADNLADAIKAEAPRDTGALAESVKVRRKRNELELEVTAGGELTTKEIRAGSGVSYDYALAAEYGTSKQAAQPFFYNTFHAREDEIRERIQDKMKEIIQ